MFTKQNKSGVVEREIFDLSRHPNRLRRHLQPRRRLRRTVEIQIGEYALLECERLAGQVRRERADTLTDEIYYAQAQRDYDARRRAPTAELRRTHGKNGVPGLSEIE